MKKAIIKTRTIITVLTTFLILGYTQAVQSAEVEQPVKKDSNSLEFKFVGRLKSGPLFQLDLNNPEADGFLIKVKDADGTLLYREEVKGVNVSRKYQLAIESEEMYEAFKVKFEITNLKTNKTSIFNASAKNRTVSDIIIAKL